MNASELKDRIEIVIKDSVSQETVAGPFLIPLPATAQEVVAITENRISLFQAQELLENRTVLDPENCKSCYEPLPADEYYAKLNQDRDNWVVSINGQLHCFKFKNSQL